MATKTFNKHRQFYTQP